MQAGGDILVTQKENGQNPFYVDLAADGSSRTTTIAAGRTNFQIYVQKITVAVVTHANAKKIVFQDTTGTPIPFWTFNDLTFAAGVKDVVTVDFGPHGTALAIGQGLAVLEPGSGTVAVIHVEGYYKLAAVISLTTADTAR